MRRSLQSSSSLGEALFRAVPIVAVSTLLLALAIVSLLLAAFFKSSLFWNPTLISLGASFLAAALIAIISDVWLSRLQSEALARRMLDDIVSSLPSDEEKERYLVDLLNSRFRFLNDPNFGRDVVRYLVAESQNGVYCHDLNTTFTFNHIGPKDFPKLHQMSSPLLERCFHLTIRERVEKICFGNAVRFAAVLDFRRFAPHFANRDFDFVWFIDLPSDVAFDGKASDIFKVQWLDVNGHLMDPKITLDEPMEFGFEIDISKLRAGDHLFTLGYEFHTVKGKDFRFVSHGTRFFTRTMATRVAFGSETAVTSAYACQQFSGIDKPKPYDFDFATREVMASGWLLPRSGVTFVFRYDGAPSQT